METIRKGNSYKGSRLIIKGFKTRDEAHAFLNKQNDNSWTPNSFPDYFGNVAATATLKPGTYAFAGGAWHNVKSLDPSALSHI